MKDRCRRPKAMHYAEYGGRGIAVCERWANSFQAFWEDMGPRPEGYTLERTDNSKGYSPENCRWATRTEQANNKRSNRFTTLNGERMTYAQAARATGVTHWTVRRRALRGLDPYGQRIDALASHT